MLTKTKNEAERLSVKAIRNDFTLSSFQIILQNKIESNLINILPSITPQIKLQEKLFVADRNLKK